MIISGSLKSGEQINDNDNLESVLSKHDLRLEGVYACGDCNEFWSSQPITNCPSCYSKKKANSFSKRFLAKLKLKRKKK